MPDTELNPSLSVYDQNGNHIKTDVLVSGYIREIIDIPSEIIHLCFLYWFIDICDTWDKSKSQKEAIITGQCVKSSPDDYYTFTVYGSRIIESGSY